MPIPMCTQVQQPAHKTQLAQAISIRTLLMLLAMLSRNKIGVIVQDVHDNTHTVKFEPSSSESQLR